MLKIPEHLFSLDCPDLVHAARAAQSGAAAILAGLDDDLHVERKDVADFVTTIDHAAEAAILATLTQRGIAREVIVSEESDDTDATIADGWLVDPLDGTSSVLFRCGPAYPTTIIVRIVDARPHVALVVFPMTGQWYYAVRGQGAYCNGRRLQISEAPTLGNAWVALNRFGDSSRQSPAMARLDQNLRSSKGAGLVTCEVPHSGMACRVAEGIVGAVVHDNCTTAIKQCSWDVAPQLLIVAEAGGIALGLDGEPVNCFAPKPYLVAQSRDLAEQIVALAN